jgi:hypothetical protein
MFCLLPRCAHSKVGQWRCFPKIAIVNVLFLFAAGGLVTLTDCAGIAGPGLSHYAVDQIRMTISPAPTPTVAGVFSFVAGSKDRAGRTLQGSLSLLASAGSEARQCFAPSYRCARSDSSVIPVDTLPNWGGLKGAGTIFTDPSFNSGYPPRYVRVTDANSGPNRWFSVGSGNGDDSHFNLDDTLLWLTNDGNAIYVFGLNPVTMQTGLISSLPPGKYCCNGQWSQTNRNYFYTMTRDGKLWKLDFAGLSLPSPGTPTASRVYDFGTSCGVSGIVLLNFSGVGGNDTVFSATFGAQDSATKIASYNSSSGKCFLYDTRERAVTQYPGGSSLGPVTTSEGFPIHGAHGFGDGTWMVVTRTGGGYYKWTVGTTEVSTCTAICDGHATGTASGFFNDGSDGGGGVHNPSLTFHSLAHFADSTNTELNTGNTTININTFETHPTAKNDPLGNHFYPIFASTHDTATATAYANEIIAWPQTPGPVLRFGHTFNSGQSAIFQAQIAVGAVSSTGRFYAFTTDGEGTLGNIDGVHSTCKLLAGTCRNDVFILNLAPLPAN